jgi:tetratricopeptide (TPR) repeat protein
MRKLLIAILLLVNVNVVYSQKFEKKIASSDKNIADIKKGANPKTWITRGELFYDIANEPISNLMIGMNENSYRVAVQGDEFTDAREIIDKKEYKVHTFPNKKIYLTSGTLMFWDILKYESSDPMQKAYEAFIRAKILDTEGKNSKKIISCLNSLAELSKSEAFNKYYLSKFPESIDLFRLSIDCSSDPLIRKVDSLGYYFVGVISSDLGNDSIAEKYLRKAIEIGYIDNGNAYAYLGKVLTNLKRTNESREILEKGLAKTPDNQQIIFSLINNYMASGKKPREIIPLIKKAQKLEPTNPGLYTVEGQLYEKTGDLDAAVECFKKSVEIAPDYFYGYSCLGLLYFNAGAKYTEQAVTEKDNAEYERLLTLSDEQLKAALPFLEKAFDLANDDKILAQPVIQALKDINFRFRYINDTYKENAEKYTKFLELGEN